VLALNLLLPLSFLFVLAIGAALWWAIFSGQMDDVEQQGASILQDDDAPAQAGLRVDSEEYPSMWFRGT